MTDIQFFIILNKNNKTFLKMKKYQCRDIYQNSKKHRGRMALATK